MTFMINDTNVVSENYGGHAEMCDVKKDLLLGPL